jgi:hypothetical protein
MKKNSIVLFFVITVLALIYVESIEGKKHKKTALLNPIVDTDDVVDLWKNDDDIDDSEEEEKTTTRKPKA